MCKEIEGETCYPIYTFAATWIEDDDTGRHKNSAIALPDGRFWDHVSAHIMYREEPHFHELQKSLIDWWEGYKEERCKDKNTSTPILHVELFEWETWVLTWFQHHTFDNGQNDRAVLASFERFVQRKERLNHKSQRETGKDTYCLMGAEDRWRWHGVGPDGYSDSPAPCRCKYCKEQGVV